MAIKNSTLYKNNISLEEILTTINELPDKGAELPELSNPGTAEDVMSSKEVIGADGNIITGTFTIDDEMTAQDGLIEQIFTAIEGKGTNHYTNGYDAGYDVGYTEGQKSMVDESKIIEKTVTGKGGVVANDVSEIPHDATVKLSSDTITDFSGVEVISHGVNRLDTSKFENSASWAMDAYSDVGYLKCVAKVNLDTPTYVGMKIPVKLTGEPYIYFKGTVTVQGLTRRWARIYFYDKNDIVLKSPNVFRDTNISGSYNFEHWFTVPSDCDYCFLWLYGIDGDTCEKGAYTEWSNLIVSTVDVPYTPYCGLSYVANQNGEFIISSFSPYMILTTEEDIGISLTYHKSYGMQAEEERWWDAIQQYGKRVDYTNAFIRWEMPYIRPKYKVIPTAGGMSSVFIENPALRIVEKEYFDFSQLPNKSADYICNACYELEKFEDIGILAYSYTCSWRYCRKLKTIEVVRANENTTFRYTFDSDSALENVIFEGVIGQNGLNLQWSTNLSHESLMSVINCLKDYSTDTSGTTWTVTIGDTNKAKLTEAELLIAENKGWVIV